MSSLIEGSEQLERALTPEPVAVPATGSLLLHGGLLAAFLLYGVMSGLFHHNLWGNQGLGGAMQVHLESNAIPLPNNQPVNQNVLATETPSQAPAPPAPKQAQKVDETAIPIQGKQVKPKQQTMQKTQQHQPPPPQNRAAYGEQTGTPIPRATAAQQSATQEVNVANGDFGSRFPWYVQVIKTKVDQNWNRGEVDPSTPKGTIASIYFRVTSAGVPQNFKVSNSSGSPTLDRSCLAAAERVDTFGPLPAGSNVQWLDVTYDCTNQP